MVYLRMGSHLKNIKRAQGAVLIVTLLFCFVMTFLVSVGWEVALLQMNMILHFKQKLIVEYQAKTNRRLLEQALEVGNEDINVTFYERVPDTLQWNETEGRDYYQLTVEVETPENAREKFLSYYAVRKSLDGKAPGTELVRFKDGKVLRLVVRQNTLYFFEEKTGEILKSYTLTEKKDSSLFALPADTKQQGFVDAIYVNNAEGELWKIQGESVFNLFVRSIFFDGSINYIGAPIVGRHPEGKGVLIYLQGQKRGVSESIIYALWDENKSFYLPISMYFVIKNSFSLSSLSLRQGYLVTSTQEGQPLQYDAYSGEKAIFLSSVKN